MGTDKKSYKEYHRKVAVIEFPSYNGCMHIASYMRHKSEYIALSISS